MSVCPAVGYASKFRFSMLTAGLFADVRRVVGPISCLALLLATSWPAARCRGDETPAAAALSPEVTAQLNQAVAGLDANQFVEREAAARQLDDLVKQPQWGPALAAEFGRRLLAGDTSFEVRVRLERYLEQLPRPAPPAQPQPKAADIGLQLDRLASDLSAERDAAQRRLTAMLEHVELVGPVLTEAKARLADASINRQTRRALENVLDRAREVWVNADPAQVKLPPVSAEQMARWIDDNALAEPLDARGRVRRDVAHRELVDLLVRDDTRAVLLEVLAQRIGATGDDAIKGRCEELVEYARPSMAAEVWSHQRHDVELGQGDDWNHRQHITVQHLIVGVPQMAETAQRPTHFDRIDNETAHCVSGNSLDPGDYPVGEAIPHPKGQEVMFYLVNLPTPRERMAYAYRLRRDEAVRLLEISQRTLDKMVARRAPLDEKHVTMLMQLDPRAVSRFVGPYLDAVPDQPLVADGGDLAGQLTLHTAICSVLITVGTHEAVPALEKLARSDRWQKPNHENPIHIAWVAALAIAMRDPWPGLDDWLASLVDETEPLLLNADPVPDLGATAAGLLLERHQVSPYSFDLEPAGNDAFDRSRFAGYAFLSPEGRQMVRDWWQKQRSARSQPAAP
ncbi:MAG: hypothetical protein AB7O59_01940 [Pirellulales bacterium]